MFVFDYSEDIDIATYEYRIYEANQVEPDSDHPGYYKLINAATIDSGTITPYSQGFNLSNVFTVAVENSTTTSSSTTTSPISYYGAIRPVDTSANLGPWTLITKTSTDTPLIDQQYIGSLTAAKITAGEIGAHEIILGGANSIIRSSTYNFIAETNTTGWYIRGDGHFSLGGPKGITYDNQTVVIGDDVQVTANLAADSISVGGVTKLNINNNIASGVGGMTVGDPTYNYWYANGLFSVGQSGKYFKWDGTNITTTGTIIGTPTINGGTITGSSLDVGSGTSSFHVDVSGRIWSGNSAFGSAPFSVTAQGALTATNANITGAIHAASGSFTGKITVPGTQTQFGTNINDAANYQGIKIGGIAGEWKNAWVERNDGSVYFNAQNPAGTNRFYMDSTNSLLSMGNGAFSVNNDGAMTATGANIHGIINTTSGTIGGWLIDSTGLQKTESGSSSNIYPGQIRLGILTDEVSGDTTLSAARVTLSDDNYLARNKTSGYEIIALQPPYTTSYFKHFGAQLYGSMIIFGGNISATNISGTGGTVSAVNVSTDTITGHAIDSSGGIAFPASITDGAIIPLTGQGPWKTNLQWTNGGGGRLYYQINNDSNVKGYLTRTGVSDRRLKSNINQEIKSWLSKFNQIKIYEFDYNNLLPQAGDHEYIPDGIKKLGVIADEIEVLFPEFVLGTAKEEILIQSFEGKTQKEKEELIGKFNSSETTVKVDGIYSKAEYQQVDYSSFVPLLMAVNLNQNKLIEQLSAKVDELESRLV
jgi:Chaperone of endosialidase